MISIVTVEAALRYWLLQATGLTEGEVYFQDQSGHNPPSGNYVTLRFALLEPVSPHDDVLHRPLSPASSREIEHRVIGYRTLGIYTQFHSRSVYGAGSAFELARKAQTSLHLPHITARLNLAGLAVQDPGVPRNIATLLDTRYQGRYSLDVRFNATDEAVATIPFIEKVTGTGTVTSPSGASYDEAFSVSRPPPEP